MRHGHDFYKMKYVRYMAKALKPPSTTATVPVTKLAASEMRYWMVPHSSSGLPKRLKGVWRITSAPLWVRDPSGLVRSARFWLVRKKPGAIALTRIEGVNFVATSFARKAVKLEIPALAAA